jgi:hypothetical protein
VTTKPRGAKTDQTIMIDMTDPDVHVVFVSTGTYRDVRETRPVIAIVQGVVG